MTSKIQQYDFKKGLTQEFEIVDFEQLFKLSSEKILKPHRTEFYQILWFQSGKPTHFIDFKPIEIDPNTILFVNKNSVQRFDSNSKFKGKAILFTDGFFCKSETDTQFLRSSILFNDLLSISQIKITNSIPVFANILQQIETELDYPKDGFQSDILRNHLRNFLLNSERVRRHQDFIELKKGADLDYALLFKDLLDNHFKSQKKVSYYCEQMHLSPKRLTKATKRIFGKTPKELIDERVLLASKRLLVHTNESIKEITFLLGFEEPTNFIKYFKNLTGSTPVDFRSEYAH